MSTLNRAREIARLAHDNQTDRYGKPFIGHPTRICRWCNSSNERIVAMLHDVVEKSEWSIEQLIDEGFAPEVIAAVQCLTKFPNEPYDNYIERVASNQLATNIKIRDLADNMNLRRFQCLGNAEIERLKRYHKAYLRLRPLYENSLSSDERYAELRKSYPNAYRPWSDSDEQKLQEMIFERVKLSEIARRFGRQPSAISTRIKRMGM